MLPCVCASRQCRLRESCDCPPLPPVMLQQIAGFLRPPTAGSIVGKLTRRQRLPDVEDRIDDAPAGLDNVSALQRSELIRHPLLQQPALPRRLLPAREVGPQKAG